VVPGDEDTNAPSVVPGDESISALPVVLGEGDESISVSTRQQKTASVHRQRC
jgi:hypothetical protein